MKAPQPEEYRRSLDRVLVKLQSWEESVKREEKTLLTLTREREDLLLARRVVQEVSQSVQQQVHGRISGVVTRCLKAVFGEEAYTLRIVFEQKRGKTEARLGFTRTLDGSQPGEELELEDVLNSCGGGVVDVAGFALRVVCLVLALPRKRRLLLVDEPFKHLSARHRPRVRELLEVLCQELGLQIIQVTHSKSLTAGEVVEIG